MLKSLRSSHPNPVQIFRLWQVFLDNVNPLTKIIHAPTVQQQILQASGDLEGILPMQEALMFSIYLAAVTSLQDEECCQVMGETRSVLLARFSNAAQQALINVKFLRTSSLVVLQALTLFLVSNSPRDCWTRGYQVENGVMAHLWVDIDASSLRSTNDVDLDGSSRSDCL